MRFILSLALLAGACWSFLRGEGAPADEKPGQSADRTWAYRTPMWPVVPISVDPGKVRNPIDAFVLARLAAGKLTPVPEASRDTLIRRVYFDLIGLPPSPEEVAAFERDTAPDAYDRLVDRLLASPRHGERWAMFWLDLVRFAESDGFKADDVRPEAWRYRDYVIRAFNQDKPYDRFLHEQLAGDELFPGDAEALIATGLHRHAPYEYNAVNLEQKLQDMLNDVTDLTGSAFLGLTVGCARCHDHKFDPITQEDFYRLQAFFAGIRPADAPVARAEETARFREQLRAWEERTAELRKKMADLEEPARQKFTAKRKARFPKEYQDIYDLPDAQRTPRERQIADLVARQVDATGAEVAKSMKADLREQWQAMNKQMEQFNREKPAVPQAMALADVGPVAPTTHLLKRGDWRSKGKEVPPGFLSAIEDRFPAIPPPAAAQSSGRRGVLAQWLTKPDHPLTARVIANRLWQHHFGRGLVATASDFGLQGDPPTHPELLDWLARELIDQGWSLKHLHRLMVTSATYRQSSQWHAGNAAADPENKLLWRMNRRRLEGESLRDAVLAVNGQLNLKTGGPSVFPELPSELGPTAGKWPVSKEAAERNRRSVYVFVKRNLRYPLFDVYDAPDSSESCARRHVSTNAPQALMLLNSKLVLDQAQAFAERVLREVGEDRERLTDRAFQLAFGRRPDQNEASRVRAFLEGPNLTEAVADLCHTLLNANEFLYVD